MTALTPEHGPIDPLAAFRLDGRVAIVTGASSGLGARFARVLDGVGARVVLVARRRDRLEILAKELQDAVVVEVDIGAAGAADTVVAAALDACGRVDVLVNNAGIGSGGPALKETDEDLLRQLQVNLVGLYALTRRSVQAMLDGGHGGSVVNVASIAGVVGIGQVPQAAYAASKAGVVGLTRELGAQWARKGVRVNAIVPGMFETEMTEPLFSDERLAAWVAGKTPLSRGGQPHELDGALLLLASDAGSYMVGTTVTVDGGWTAI
jgi:NAD(P)-dependent dehydrogenase (short-subunit alcohol dehydrogenase family)